MKFNYPPARRDGSVVDDYHGTKIADPYRWLEDPDSEETKEFVEAQNAVSSPFIEQCEYRQKIQDSLTEKWNFAKYSSPAEHGGYYYYYHNSGLQNQSVMYVQDSLDGEPRVFLDPNKLSEDGTLAISGTAFSEDGSYFAYGLSQSGSDWITIKFKDCPSGKDLPDTLEHVKFSSMAWTHDNKGMFYNRYPVDGKSDGTETTSNFYHRLYYHVLGTKQSEDVLAVEFLNEPKWKMETTVANGKFTSTPHFSLPSSNDNANQMYETSYMVSSVAVAASGSNFSPFYGASAPPAYSNYHMPNFYGLSYSPSKSRKLLNKEGFNFQKETVLKTMKKQQKHSNLKNSQSKSTASKNCTFSSTRQFCTSKQSSSNENYSQYGDYYSNHQPSNQMCHFGSYGQSYCQQYGGYLNGSSSNLSCSSYGTFLNQYHTADTFGPYGSGSSYTASNLTNFPQIGANLDKKNKNGSCLPSLPVPNVSSPMSHLTSPIVESTPYLSPPTSPLVGSALYLPYQNPSSYSFYQTSPVDGWASYPSHPTTPVDGWASYPPRPTTPVDRSASYPPRPTTPVDGSALYPPRPTTPVDGSALYPPRPTTPVDGSVLYPPRPTTPVDGSALYPPRPTTPVDGSALYPPRPTTPVDGSALYPPRPTTPVDGSALYPPRPTTPVDGSALYPPRPTTPVDGSALYPPRPTTPVDGSALYPPRPTTPVDGSALYPPRPTTPVDGSALYPPRPTTPVDGSALYPPRPTTPVDGSALYPPRPTTPVDGSALYPPRPTTPRNGSASYLPHQTSSVDRLVSYPPPTTSLIVESTAYSSCPNTFTSYPFSQYSYQHNGYFPYSYFSYSQHTYNQNNPGSWPLNMSCGQKANCKGKSKMSSHSKTGKFASTPDTMFVSNFRGAEVSDCGKYLLLSPNEGCDPVNRLFYVELDKLANGITGKLPYTVLVDNFDAQYEYITNEGTVFTFLTNLNAPKYKVINIDFNKPEQENWQTLIEEDENAVLEWVSCVNKNKLVLCYLKDVKNKMYVHSLETGKLIKEIPLDIGTVIGCSGKKKNKEIFIHFMSFLTPGVIYRVDLSVDDPTPEVYRLIKVSNFDFSQFEIKQIFYPSKDGTKIPMFLVHKKGVVLDGKNPTYLYGYGGFEISIKPTFSVSRLVFLKDLGGLFAVANIRGGGEYGETWHKSGTHSKKQNVFDDFQAAAEYLIAQKYTTPEKLVIHGHSNGGLLIAACINQRPDLYGAAIAQVGVLDMLRFHKFTIGHAWTTDFGCSEVPEHFKFLKEYSPIHNIRIPKGDVQYPSTLLVTADHDDRVVPLHSLKFIAELQHTMKDQEKQTKPLMIKVDTKAGHGSGKPTAKMIQEHTDLYCFIMKTLELTWHNS